MPTITILTYNLLFGKALLSIPKLIAAYAPDVICLQEFEIHTDAIATVERCGYYLADYSHSFSKFFRLYGIATFYNPHTVTPQGGDVITLSRSVYEMALLLFPRVNHRRTALKTTYMHNESKKTFDVYNLHLTFHGTNQARRKQLQAMMGHLEAAKQKRIIIAGDFNYPYHRKSLEELIQQHELKEATNNLLYTLENKVFGVFTYYLKPDYILYRGLTHLDTKREEDHTSDHFPIIARFSL